MKRLFALLIALVISMGCIACGAPKVDTATQPEATIETVLPPLEYGLLDYEYVEYNNSDAAWIEYITMGDYIVDLYAQLANLDTTHPDYEEVSLIIQTEITRIDNLERQYFEDYQRLLAEEEEAAKWETRIGEYPVATEVWLYLKETLGYSDAACAGVIANMMAECGGCTLELKWWSYNSSNHYGLCQWSPVYYPNMQGASLEEQLEFMATSFPEVIDRYGYLYQKNFKHEDFATMTDAGDAAYAFCIIYERPGGNQNHRRTYAETALEYFTS